MGDLNPDDSRMGIYLSRSSHSSVSVFQLDSTAFLSGAQTLENLYNYSEILRKGSDKATLFEIHSYWKRHKLVLSHQVIAEIH